MARGRGRKFHNPPSMKTRDFYADCHNRYKTAEACSARLTEMSHNLTSMIEEINSASTNLRQSNKSANTQDPLSQIVRVLNGHLTQLQLIDSGASTLQQKVAAAQKEARSIGRNGGLGNDEVDLRARVCPRTNVCRYACLVPGEVQAENFAKRLAMLI